MTSDEAPATTTKQCPYCAETIQAAAIVCRYCGHDLVEKESAPVAAPAEADDRAALDRAIANYTGQGWQVVSQTETTAQLKKSREWNKPGLILFVALPLLGALFYGPLLYVAIFGLLLIVADYLLKKEHLMFLTAEKVRERKGSPHIETVEYGRAICSVCREYVRPGAAKCKRCGAVFAPAQPPT